MSNKKIELQISFTAFDKKEDKRYPYNAPIGTIYEELNEICTTFNITDMNIVINDEIVPKKK